MELYRLITGKDDSDFCKRISALLNKGWILYGSPSLAAGKDGNQVAQAVLKTVEDEEWSDDVDLSKY